jgi:hypothetical protein
LIYNSISIYFPLVLHPVNLTIDLIIILQPGEYNFQRPGYDIDIYIEELSLNIDPKQFSDLLDFIKFQNYNKLYGMEIVNKLSYSFCYFCKDRCKEYRELQLQRASEITELTLEEKERVRVRFL